MRRLALVALPLVLAACGNGRVSSVQGELQLTPAALDFGTRPVLDDETLKVHVLNVGRAPVKITATLSGDKVFTLVKGPSELDGGAEGDFAVNFDPTEEKTYAGKLVLDTDEQDVHHHEIPLHGVGSTVAAVNCAPDHLDFGVVGEDRVKVLPVTCTSTGTAPLILKQLGFGPGTNPAYGFQGSAHVPATLKAHVDGAPDDLVEIDVKFAPTAATVGTDMTGSLVLVTTDPDHQKVTIPLTAALNQQPVAVPGPDQQVAPGSLVSLDGSRSYDPDHNDPLAYAWTLLHRPQGSSAAIPQDQAAEPQATFTADQPGEYDVTLQVTDSLGLSSKVATVTITAVAADKLVIELIWDHPTADLDLHFMRPGDQLDGPDDCYWANPHPDWGVVGDPTDDPANLGDKLAGFGPEYVDYENPPNGGYLIAVKYVSANGAAQTKLTATIRVQMYGVVMRELDHVMNNPGEVWNAGEVFWPTGNVTTGATGSTP